MKEIPELAGGGNVKIVFTTILPLFYHLGTLFNSEGVLKDVLTAGILTPSC